MKSSLRKALVALGLLAALPALAAAQEPTQVTGQVTAAATGQPMAGVQVMVKGTTLGVLTDGSGRYSIRVPSGRTELVFTFIGYRTVEAEITGSTLDVQLHVQPVGLDGIVVTALGVTREKRELGYSVQDIQGSEIAAVPQLNLVNALSGNAAGVQVTNVGPPGGTSRILIRGASSIAGDNQPLFVVDGVPIDNSSPRNQGYGGVDYGNAAGDIDPANIESISILKGPNAAALYGSRAANGAIVITTKSGAASGSGLGITASTGVVFDTPLRLPSYQNLYGQGFNGEFRYVDGTGTAPGNLNDGADESWGPRLDTDTVIDQFHGPGQPWVSNPDNVRNFFDLGRTVTNNVAFARSGDRTSMRLSITNTNMNGMAPGNEIDNTSVALRGTVELTDRLSANSSINYIHREGNNRPGTGYSGQNFMQQFVWFGRQVDLSKLKDYKNEDGTPRNWNYNYHSNPYWLQLENRNWDTRDRVIGHVGLNYRVTDWMSAELRTGRDWYQDFRKRTFAAGTVGIPNGAFAENLISRVETNTDLLLTATRELTPDLTLRVNGGASQRVNEAQTHDISVGRLTVPGIYSLGNAAETPSTSQFFAKKQVNSLLGSASLGYRGFLTVDVTGRNDWSSTLPEASNSFFYPSVSGAFIFTDAFGLQNRFLTYGKLRASWTRVGNDTEPYQLASVYGTGTPWAGAPAFTVPNQLANLDLRPEETTSVELGTDLDFLDGRLGFALTYYDSRTRDQILGVQVSSTSGYTSRILNAGEVRNYGYELLANATPVRLDNGFSWDVTVNYSQPKNEVVDLYGDVDSYNLGTYWGLAIQARKGEPYGAFYGNQTLRNEDGKIVVNSNGVPMIDPDPVVLGNYNPDWTAGINNRLRYGNLDFSFLIDTRQGGQIFSVTNWFGLYAGVLEETIQGRENYHGPLFDENGDYVFDEDGRKIIICDPGIVVPGVKIVGESDDGSPIYADNDIKVCPQQYYHGIFQNHERGMFDASFVKLREVKLGYTLPQALVGRIGLSNAHLSLVGRNLWLWTKTPHIDPETGFDASNVQGIEFGQFPTGRSIGFTLSIQP